MKVLMLLIAVVLSAKVAQANEFDFIGVAGSASHAVSCIEFKYTDRLTVDVNLETRQYVVKRVDRFLTPGPELLGKGRIGDLVERRGAYLIYKLYEKSKYVGFLQATEAGQYTPKRSRIVYKGEEATSIYCRFQNQ